MLVLKELVEVMLGRRRKTERATEGAATAGVGCVVGGAGSGDAGSGGWAGAESRGNLSMVDGVGSRRDPSLRSG